MPASSSVKLALNSLPLRGKARLLVLSSLMLFIELALIRWTAENVVYLAYFSNFVLLASFLGIGVGFLRGDRAREGFTKAPFALAGLMLFVTVLPVGAQLGSERTFTGLFGGLALPPFVELPILFVAVTYVMAFIAEGVAASFKEFEALEAYKLDITGSLLGIVCFTALAFLGLPPLAWGIISVAAFVLLLGRDMGILRWSALGIVLLLLGAMSLSPNDSWSPYYKVTAKDGRSGMVSIKVNGHPHQSIYPMDLLKAEQPFYFFPYEHLKGNSLEDVLIIGAGSGNDVAVALAQGAGHVDAVEIDPVLQRIGQDQHPEHPYQDPRVSAHIDDGRAFLQRSDARYDLIMLALPDSLTLVSGQSSLRLESYLFTLEAMRNVKAHLKADGVFAMYNYYRPDVFNRFANTLQVVFGHAPCAESAKYLGPRQQAVLEISIDPSTIDCATPWVAPAAGAPEPSTDDYPFPYLQTRSIPAFYIWALGLILAFSLFFIRRVGGPFKDMSPYLDLFFMGAAFLLIETKNVVQFALLFGTTWMVNALVFTGVLLAVLGAVVLARTIRLPKPWVLYSALVAALVLAWMVPAASLLSFPVIPRFAISVGIAFAPIFLANLVFAQRFKEVSSSTAAFGANLLGAMAGGILEYAALIVGYRALAILAVIIYAAAFVAGRRHIASVT